MTFNHSLSAAQGPAMPWKVRRLWAWPLRGCAGWALRARQGWLWRAAGL